MYTLLMCMRVLSMLAFYPISAGLGFLLSVINSRAVFPIDCRVGLLWVMSRG
jgi:hypothetical protein